MTSLPFVTGFWVLAEAGIRLRIYIRREPKPGRQLPTVSEGLDVTDRGQQGGRSDRADARDRLQALYALIRAGDLMDLFIEVSDTFVQIPQFLVQPGPAPSGGLGHRS